MGCQSINKIQNTNLHNNGANLNTTQTDEDGYCLCALTWFSTQEEKNKLLIFDLNQWYKEEMPFSITNQKYPSYLAGYVLSGRQRALSAYLNPSTVAHFNSLQRFEEHFYPNSLSFGEYDYYVQRQNDNRDASEVPIDILYTEDFVYRIILHFIS